MLGKMMYVMEEAGRLAAAPMKDDDSGKETTFASRNIRKFSRELGMRRNLRRTFVFGKDLPQNLAFMT